MPNKVKEFPQTNGKAEVPIDQPMVLFSLGGRRFAAQWIVTELCAQLADVIPIEKRQKKKRPHSAQT